MPVDLIPPLWKVPQVFRDRMGEQVGRQRPDGRRWAVAAHFARTTEAKREPTLRSVVLA